MPSALPCVRGVRGAACPTTCPVGRRSMATSAGGGGRPPPARPSSTASRSRPRRWRVPEATVPTRRSRGASATSWLTPWGCSWLWSCTPPTSRTGTERGGSWPGWGTASRAAGHLGRQRLPGPQAGRLPTGPRLGPGDRAPTDHRTRLPGAAPALGGGAHLRLAGTVPAVEQGLRGLAGNLRDLDPARHDRPHAASTRPCLTPYTCIS